MKKNWIFILVAILSIVGASSAEATTFRVAAVDFTRQALPLVSPWGSELPAQNWLPGVGNGSAFALKSDVAVNGVNVRLVRADGSPKLAFPIDIRLIKHWYKAKSYPGWINNLKEPVLEPELLLHDSEMIQLDETVKKNYAHVFSADGLTRHKLEISSIEKMTDKRLMATDERWKWRDGLEIRPFDVTADKNLYLYLSANIDSSAKGISENIQIQFYHPLSNQILASFPLQIKIGSFELEKDGREHGLFYRGVLDESVSSGPSSEIKSESQFSIEMKNMAEHGVNAVALKQPLEPKTRFWKAVKLMQGGGINSKTFYTLALDTGNYTALASNEQKLRSAQKLKNELRKVGYDSLAIYGLDEPKKYDALAVKPLWRHFIANGIEVFFASDKKEVEKVASDLKIIYVDGLIPRQSKADLFHTAGARILSYRLPFPGVTQAHAFRYNYGLLQWKTHYDGSMNYAYQDAQGFIWNDFDGVTTRDLVFAYPVDGGVIDTISWESFREGVNDLRLLATVEKLIASHPSTTADAAQTYLSQIQHASPDQLNLIRTKLFYYAERLSALCTGGAAC